MLEASVMEPVIVDRSRMILVGFGFFGDPFGISTAWSEENEIGRLWKRLMAYLSVKGERIPHVTSDRVMYEVHVQHPETAETGEVEVFVGLEVDELEKLPPELLAKILPPTTYAVFTLEGEQIVSDWPLLIYNEWLPTSDYQSAHPYSFQRYDERFQGMDRVEDSVLEVYVPVSQRTA
jgi:predicted transcriptional regulator YdeE